MRALLLCSLALGFGGCSHYMAEKGASYHEAKADQAAARGDYGTAAAHEQKAMRDQQRAATAPLP